MHSRSGGELTGCPEVGDGRLHRDRVPQPGGGRIGDDVRVEHGRIRRGKVRPVRADQQPPVRISGGRQQGAEPEGVAEDVTVFTVPFADEGFCLAATRSIAQDMPA